ncbi:hypothetical protein OQA88_13189 [Cercophora sp. LCS_1]
MAAPTKVPTLEDLELSKFLYNALRAAREQLLGVNLEMYRLLTLKSMYAKSEEEIKAASELLKQHNRAAFGKQDPFDVDGDQEWYQRKRTIIKSPEFINQELDIAKTAKAGLESIHDALRSSINQLSRPFLRKLTILDLPDEILLEIFAHLDTEGRAFGRRPYIYWRASEDIQALRLVSRRISTFASCLLVRVFYLDLHDESSLQRMEEISRHPTISKGVHVIQVNLEFYNTSFTNFNRYLSHFAGELEKSVYVYDGSNLWGDSTSEVEAARLITDGKEIVNRLRCLASGEESEEDTGHASQVRQTHKMYLQLLAKQESLLEDDNFYRAVGSAIARMPCARTLVFHESPRCFRGLSQRAVLVPGTDVWERLGGWMLMPPASFEVDSGRLDQPSLRCVTRLIDAVRDAGAFLHYLEIRLPSGARPMDLVPAPVSPSLFSSGMRHLKSFDFQYEYDSLSMDEDEEVEDHDQDDLRALGAFLSACLDTPSLQSLQLYMRSRDQVSFPLRLKDILGQNPSRDKLTDIFLGNLELNSDDLIAFLRRLPQPMEWLSLDGVYLLTGSWREVLDVSRDKKPKIVQLRDLAGAECVDMSEEQCKKLFERSWGYRSEVEAYVGGLFSENPFQTMQNSTAGAGGNDAPDVEEGDAMDVEA